MVDREDVASWLQGPGRVSGDGSYPGQRLGLPESGPGSVAGFGRRLVAVFVDWLACLVIARAISEDPWVPLLVFLVENVVLVSTLQATFGMRLLGLRVVRVGRSEPVAPWRALVRSVLLALLIPATVWDRDGRGLHDKAAGTVVVRGR